MLVLVLAGSMAVSRWIDRGLTETLEAEHATNPVADLRKMPEAPELQALASAELERQRAEEEAALHAPASWIDPVNGIVRIPIEEALEKVLVEGFPVRAEVKR